MKMVELSDYYRRDKESGISPPNLANDCTIPEHIVRARGKRTRFTSVSLDPDKIRGFGNTLYKLLKEILLGNEHELIEHAEVLKRLRDLAKGKDNRQKDLALRAIPRVKRTLEGLIEWRFKIPSSIEIKNLIIWAETNIQKYFKRI